MTIMFYVSMFALGVLMARVAPNNWRALGVGVLFYACGVWAAILFI